MRFKRWLGCLGGGGCFSRHRGAGDSNAAARAASAAESAAEAAVRKAEAVVRKAEAASSAAVRKAEAAVRKAEAAAAEELAVSSILDRWDRKIPVPEIAPLPPAAPIDDAIAKEVKSEELDATNLKDDANSNTNVMEIQVELVEAEQFVEVSEESLDGAEESEGEDEEVVYVIEEGEEAAEGGDPVKVNDSDDGDDEDDSDDGDDEEVEVEDVIQKGEESTTGSDLVKVNGQEMSFDGGGDSEAAEGEEVLDDVSEEGEEAAEEKEVLGDVSEEGEEAAEEKEVLGDVSEEGEEAAEEEEVLDDVSKEGEEAAEEKEVLGDVSEEGEEAAEEEEVLDDVSKEGEEAAEEKEVLGDVSEEGEEAAEEKEVLGDVSEEGEEAAEEKEVLGDVSEEGEEAAEEEEVLGDVSDEGAEEKEVLGVVSEEGEEAAEEKEVLGDVSVEGEEAAEEKEMLGDVSDEGEEAAEEEVLGDVSNEGEEAAEEKEVLGDVSEEGEEAAEEKEVLGDVSEEGEEAAEEKEVLDNVSEEGEESAEYDGPVKVNGQEGSLVGGGDSEAEEEAAKEEEEGVSEEGKECVKGGESGQDCLLCGLDSNDDEISFAEWGNSEDEECSFGSEEGVVGAEAGEPVGELDEENNLVQWGDSEHEEGDAFEDCEDAEKNGQSIDVCNGDSGVLADRGDAEGYLIDGGEGEYEEEKLKEEVHHEVVKERPKSKQVGVFFVGSDSDPTEADVVKVLNVKVLKETLFLMDPITKTNRGFAFVHEAVFFMDPITKNTEGFAYLQCAPDDEAKAKIGVCVLSDPLVNGTSCDVVRSQDREPNEEITAQVKTVFVDDLPAASDENLIKEHVENFSDVDKTELARCQGINNVGLGRGTNKVHVRDRLSRPLERGREKYARGNFRISGGTHHMLAGHAPTGFWGHGVPSSGHQSKRPPVRFVDRHPIMMGVSESARRLPSLQQFYNGSINGVGDQRCSRGLVNTFFSRGSNAVGSSYSSYYSGRDLSASRCSRRAASCY